MSGRRALLLALSGPPCGRPNARPGQVTWLTELSAALSHRALPLPQFAAEGADRALGSPVAPWGTVVLELDSDPAPCGRHRRAAPASTTASGAPARSSRFPLGGLVTVTVVAACTVMIIASMALGHTVWGSITVVRPAATATEMDAVKVLGAFGAEPTVTVRTPFSVKQTTRAVLIQGTGPTAVAGERVTLNYVGFNGADGKKFDSSFTKGSAPTTLLLDPALSLPGLVKGIVGAKVGSRLLIAVPPADAYGTTGQASAGIGATDTILVVADLLAAKALPSRAIGAVVPPQAGLPNVRLAANGKPAITVPAGNPPAPLVVQPLIVGTGPKVAKGEQITVHYVGVIWRGGRQFDSSWDRGKPATFPIGTGQVVAGWDEGIVGQPVGSQVLLVVPPDKAYGAAGQPQAGIKGTDTLVFVVDILDAV